MSSVTCGSHTFGLLVQAFRGGQDGLLTRNVKVLSVQMTQGDSGSGVSEGGVGTSPHSLCSLAHTQGAVLCPARGQVLGAQGWEGLLALRHGNGWGAAHKGGHFYSQRNTLGSSEAPRDPCSAMSFGKALWEGFSPDLLPGGRPGYDQAPLPLQSPLPCLASRYDAPEAGSAHERPCSHPPGPGLGPGAAGLPVEPGAVVSASLEFSFSLYVKVGGLVQWRWCFW